MKFVNFLANLFLSALNNIFQGLKEIGVFILGVGIFYLISSLIGVTYIYLFGAFKLSEFGQTMPNFATGAVLFLGAIMAITAIVALVIMPTILFVGWVKKVWKNS